jgi:hypothetical protein
LCWCAGSLLASNYSSAFSFACSIAENFRTDAGELTLIGPAPLSQHRTCVSGQTCSLDKILGQDLQNADAFIILDTCARGGREVTEGEAGRYPIVVPEFTKAGWVRQVTASGAIVSWGDVPVTAPGGEYRLCWCAGLEDLGNYSQMMQENATNVTMTTQHRCSVREHFRVDLGTLTIIGPSYDKERRLNIDPSKFDKGVACKDDASGLAFLMYSSTTLSSRGIVTHPETAHHFVCVIYQDSQWYYDNNLNYLPFTPDPSDVLVALIDFSKPAYSSRITALRSNSDSYHEGIRKGWALGDLVFYGDQYDGQPNEGEFEVTGTYLTIAGFSQDRTCVSGQTCSFDGILGTHLSAGDHVTVLDTCGISHNVPRFGKAGRAQDVTSSGAIVAWESSAAVTAAGGQYRICWCAKDYSCSLAEEFRTDAGRLTLLGVSPLSQDRTCVSGQ